MLQSISPQANHLSPMQPSILKTIRLGVGVPEDYTVFDTELIMDINSAFMVLFQLGVGSAPFRITGEDEEWSDYMELKDNLEGVKLYIRDSVKLMFDPPANSFLVDLLNRRKQEFEWRINVQVDPGKEV